jgi:hypothetical protein
VQRTPQIAANIVVILVVLILSKRFCRRSRSAFGRLVATSLVSLVGQRFVPRGGPESLVGLSHQRFLLRGHPTLFVGVVGQRFLQRGGPGLLVGLVRQRFLLRGRSPLKKQNLNWLLFIFIA